MFTHTILHSILFDFLVGMIIYLYGLFFSLLTLIIAVVSETVVLHRLHYGPFMRSFGASVLMNTISAGLGFVAAFFWLDPKPGRFFTEFEYFAAQVFENIGALVFTETPGGWISSLLFLTVSFAISVAAEGLVLLALGQSSITTAMWRLSLVANGVSYALILLLLLCFFVFTHAF